MLDLTTIPANSVFTLVDNIDDTTPNPTVTLTWDMNNQGGELIIDNTPSNDVVINEMIITGSATSAKAGDSEIFYLTGGVLVAGKTRQIQFTATQRGIPDSETVIPPTTSLTRLFREHKRNSSIWLASEVLLVKNLKQTFTSTTTTETVVAGELIDSTSGNLGVAVHTDGKYYKYNNISGDITGVMDNGSGNARITVVDYGLNDGDSVNIEGTTDYNGVHVISEVLFSGAVESVSDYSGTVAGTIQMTSTAHGLETGAIITVTGTTSYNNTYTITKIDNDSFYITETFIADEAGAWSSKDLDRFDIEVAHTTSQTGIISGFENHQGIILSGQTIAVDGSFTLYNLKSIVSGFTGIGNGLVYVENGGVITPTSSDTTQYAGLGRNGIELVQAERVPNSVGLTEAQATDNSSTVFGTVSGELLGKLVASVKSSVARPLIASDISGSTLARSGNTTATWFMFANTKIALNHISLYVTSVGTAGTFKIGFYSEDGQTQYLEHTTSSIAAGGTIKETLASEVELPTGNVYVALLPVSTANASFRFWSTSPFTTNTTGEAVFEGTTTETADTLPATIDPTSITYTNNKSILIRLDN